MGAYEVLKSSTKMGWFTTARGLSRARLSGEQRFCPSRRAPERIRGLHPPRCDHAPTLLICRDCKAVAETPSAPVNEVLDKLAAASGFAVEHTSVEVQGLCPKCQDSAT